MADETKPPQPSPAAPYADALERQAQSLKHRFTYHPPKPGQPERYTRIRLQGHDLAQTIVASTPPGREQSLALTKLEEAIFWANAAIARGEP